MREQITESKMHALDYWQVVRNRWGVILLTFFLITLASLVIIALLDKKYAGMTRFQINQSSAPDVFDTTTRDARLTVTGNWLDTQVKTITSRDTLLRVVRTLNLQSAWSLSDDDAAARLERMIELEQERGTEIVSIIAWSTNATEAANLANEVRKAYEERRKGVEEERSRRQTENMQAQITRQNEAVDKARAHMMKIMETHKIVDLVPLSTGNGTTQVVQPGVNSMEEARRAQEALETDVMKLKTQLENLINLQGDQLIAGAMELGVQNATIQRVFPEYQSQRAAAISFQKNGFGRMHPKMQALAASIAEQRKQLLDAVEIFKSSLKLKIEEAEMMATGAKGRTEEKTADTITERKNQAEYATAKYQYESQLLLLQNVQEAYMRQKVDDNVTKKPVDILQEAKPEVAPSKPNVMLLLSIGAGLGLVLGLLLAFFLEYLDTSVKSLDDVERYLGVPVLAVIPKDVGVLHKQSGLSPDAEAYRILRTNIEFNRRSADANAITIVSGGAGEGKSTTLVNLAYICAQGGYNTLMIDGDLRRPKLHTFFDINNSVGLTNYLTTALMLEDVILQTPIENLYFMPSGILPADAAGILNSRRMSELIADVKNRFDLVLIDSPPILGVSDASVLASEVDLTIIVIQHRKLPRNMLLRVKQAIENVGGNLLGVVLNNVDVRSDSQYQYYTSYYTYYSPTNIDPKSKPRPSAQGAPAGRPAASPAGRGVDKDDY